MSPADKLVLTLRMYLQVTALSELVIEVWGLPSQSMFSSRRGSSSKAGLHGKADGDSAAGSKQEGNSGMSRKAGDGAAGGSGYGSQAGNLPSGSIFLGAVNVSGWAGVLALRMYAGTAHSLLVVQQTTGQTTAGDL
jgi:hypothetical protein